MGIVWPVDGLYKRVVGVADSTLGARVAGWGVFTLNILRRRGACAAPDKTGRASTSHAGRTKLFFSVRQGRRTSGMVCEGDGDQRTATARAVSTCACIGKACKEGLWSDRFGCFNRRLSQVLACLIQELALGMSIQSVGAQAVQSG